jgi:Ca2+-transporting ATPase
MYGMPYDYAGMAKAWTISLTSLAVFQWFNAWNCRHESKSVFRMNPFANKFLVGATAIVIFLQLLIIYNPVMQKLFKTTFLALSEWAIILSVAFSIILIEEIRKFLYRRREGADRQKPKRIVHPVVKKIIAVLLIWIGLIALLTPLTPGAWLIFVGLELLGFRITMWDNIKAWFKNIRQK